MLPADLEALIQAQEVAGRPEQRVDRELHHGNVFFNFKNFKGYNPSNAQQS